MSFLIRKRELYSCMCGKNTELLNLFQKVHFTNRMAKNKERYNILFPAYGHRIYCVYMYDLCVSITQYINRVFLINKKIC